MMKLPPIKSWKRQTQVLWLIAIFFLMLGSYPVLVLGYVWIKVAQSDLPGGRNGPLDAYRHTLASALVSYTLDEKVVRWVSNLMEDERIITQRMDRHNNRIGAMIGNKAKRLSEIEPAVAKKVSEGRVFARDPDQSTWLPESIWGDSKMW
jgi:hypothetical protein